MNLLLTGCFKYSDRQIEQLVSLGYSSHYIQYEEEQLPIDPSRIDCVVCNGLFLHHNIDKFSRLKFIQLTSAGFDRVPIDVIKDRGIKLFNAKGAYNTPMAEWVLFRVLEYYKSGWQFKSQQDNKLWSKNRDLREVTGSKVAVIGAGSVGQEVAKLFQALGAKTTGFDIHTNQTRGFDKMTLIATLPDIVNQFDIIVLTAPLLPSTRGMIGRRILEAMKEDSILVNIARGALIEESALIDVLSKRKNIFAALDVFEVEPLKTESPLWQMDNVALSPHNSFVGNGNNRRTFDIIYRNLKTFLDK